MKKYFIAMTILFGSYHLIGQSLTASELLEKAIYYHDPKGVWGNLKEKMFINLSFPDGRERLSKIEVDMQKDFFRLTVNDGTITTEQTLNNGECILKINGSTDISDEEKNERRLNCERTKATKDYYLYLYGLPMKLRDKGTNLDPVVKIKTFNGKEYLVLKVTYDKDVGDDTWYFYFDPKTYAMEVYQFFHDESKNDGEYILLSETIEVAKIKMPKVRAWHYNKDNKHLGTDKLIKSQPPN